MIRSRSTPGCTTRYLIFLAVMLTATAILTTAAAVTPRPLLPNREAYFGQKGDAKELREQVSRLVNSFFASNPSLSEVTSFWDSIPQCPKDPTDRVALITAITGAGDQISSQLSHVVSMIAQSRNCSTDERTGPMVSSPVFDSTLLTTMIHHVAHIHATIADRSELRRLVLSADNVSAQLVDLVQKHSQLHFDQKLALHDIAAAIREGVSTRRSKRTSSDPVTGYEIFHDLKDVLTGKKRGHSIFDETRVKRGLLPSATIVSELHWTTVNYQSGVVRRLRQASLSPFQEYVAQLIYEHEDEHHLKPILRTDEQGVYQLRDTVSKQHDSEGEFYLHYPYTSQFVDVDELTEALQDNMPDVFYAETPGARMLPRVSCVTFQPSSADSHDHCVATPLCKERVGVYVGGDWDGDHIGCLPSENALANSTLDVYALDPNWKMAYRPRLYHDYFFGSYIKANLELTKPAIMVCRRDIKKCATTLRSCLWLYVHAPIVNYPDEWYFGVDVANKKITYTIGAFAHCDYDFNIDYVQNKAKLIALFLLNYPFQMAEATQTHPYDDERVKDRYYVREISTPPQYTAPLFYGDAQSDSNPYAYFRLLCPPHLSRKNQFCGQMALTGPVELPTVTLHVNVQESKKWSILPDIVHVVQNFMAMAPLVGSEMISGLLGIVGDAIGSVISMLTDILNNGDVSNFISEMLLTVVGLYFKIADALRALLLAALRALLPTLLVLAKRISDELIANLFNPAFLIVAFCGGVTLYVHLRWRNNVLSILVAALQLIAVLIAVVNLLHSSPTEYKGLMKFVVLAPQTICVNSVPVAHFENGYFRATSGHPIDLPYGMLHCIIERGALQLETQKGYHYLANLPLAVVGSNINMCDIAETAITLRPNQCFCDSKRWTTIYAGLLFASIRDEDNHFYQRVVDTSGTLHVNQFGSWQRQSERTISVSENFDPNTKPCPCEQAHFQYNLSASTTFCADDVAVYHLVASRIYILGRAPVLVMEVIQARGHVFIVRTDMVIQDLSPSSAVHYHLCNEHVTFRWSYLPMRICLDYQSGFVEVITTDPDNNILRVRNTTGESTAYSANPDYLIVNRYGVFLKYPTSTRFATRIDYDSMPVLC